MLIRKLIDRYTIIFVWVAAFVQKTSKSLLKTEQFSKVIFENCNFFKVFNCIYLGLGLKIKEAIGSLLVVQGGEGALLPIR